MKPKEALEAMCERCHKNIQSIPSKGYLPHRECPFRHISGDYCEEYDTLKKALGETGMTKEELREKVKVLEDNDIISEIFLSTIGFDYSWRILDNEKKLKCYRNHYYTVGVPKVIQWYIDKGYMKREVEGDYSRFSVTKKGFAWLSKLIGIKVEEVD